MSDPLDVDAHRAAQLYKNGIWRRERPPLPTWETELIAQGYGMLFEGTTGVHYAAACSARGRWWVARLSFGGHPLELGAHLEPLPMLTDAYGREWPQPPPPPRTYAEAGVHRDDYRCAWAAAVRWRFVPWWFDSLHLRRADRPVESTVHVPANALRAMAREDERA